MLVSISRSWFSKTSRKGSSRILCGEDDGGIGYEERTLTAAVAAVALASVVETLMVEWVPTECRTR